MKKILLLIFAISIIFYNYTFSQDSLLKKVITTKDFSLKANYLENIIDKAGLSNNKGKSIEYENCNIVIPLSDSSFKINHISGKSILKYKDIENISFKGDSKFGTGLGQGTIIGVFTGCIAAAIIWGVAGKTEDNNTHEMKGYGKFAAFIFAVFVVLPATTLLGAITGGIIGAFTHEEVKYNFYHLTKEEKKNKFIKLMNNNQIQF